MKVIFMGTPDFCVEFAENIRKEHELTCIVTKPDRQRGRDHKIIFSSLKKYAINNDIPCLQPEKTDTRDFEDCVRRLSPEIIVVVAYGRILSGDLLGIPAGGCVNVHFSMLPEYRGPDPVRRALLNGEKKTGVCTMLMDSGVDTGDILLKKAVQVEEGDDYLSLTAKLVKTGCGLMVETLEAMGSGKIEPEKQEVSKDLRAANIVRKEEMEVCWEDDAEKIFNIIRAAAGPGAWTQTCFCGKKRTLKLLKAFPPGHDDKLEKGRHAGQLLEISKQAGMAVKCGRGFLRIAEVQEQDRRKCSAYDYICGKRLKTGDRIN